MILLSRDGPPVEKRYPESALHAVPLAQRIDA